MAQGGRAAILVPPGLGYQWQAELRDVKIVDVPPSLRCVPVGVPLLESVLAPNDLHSLIRMTGGNFRLLTRRLTQIQGVLQANGE